MANYIGGKLYENGNMVMREAESNGLRRVDEAFDERGVRFRDRKCSAELMSVAGLYDDVVVVVRSSKLRWYGHALKKSRRLYN